MDKIPVEKLKAIKKLKRKQWRKRKRERLQQERIEASGEGEADNSVKRQRKAVDASTQTDMPDHDPQPSKPVPSRGERMVKAALQRGKRKLHCESSTAVAGKSQSRSYPDVKELDRSLLSRVAGVPALGNGTFGTCYLAKYRNMDVAVKELRYDGKKTEADVKKSALKEARVLMEIGDHKGLPHLFGVCSMQKPVFLVLLFHGEHQSCLTIYKAMKASPALSEAEWRSILRYTAEALQYIHECGFIHNDLKADNIVLEKCPDDTATAYNPVIVDFGCSVKAQDSRPRRPKPNHLKEVNKNSYVAPEILDGTGKPSFSSDVFSFARMVELIHKRCNIRLLSNVFKHALSRIPEKRPALTELKMEFSKC